MHACKRPWPAPPLAELVASVLEKQRRLARVLAGLRDGCSALALDGLPSPGVQDNDDEALETEEGRVQEPCLVHGEPPFHMAEVGYLLHCLQDPAPTVVCRCRPEDRQLPLADEQKRPRRIELGVDVREDLRNLLHAAKKQHVDDRQDRGEEKDGVDRVHDGLLERFDAHLPLLADGRHGDEHVHDRLRGPQDHEAVDAHDAQLQQDILVLVDVGAPGGDLLARGP
mmetsp:Transcript_67401/g.200390  ORF Transcript_67401/g.200390 Transcript_67401/m.200390 type:complete len:226 (+) Transcript_67401:1-678(+)